MSVANRVELAIVLERQAKPWGTRQAEAFLRLASIVEEPVTLERECLRDRLSTASDVGGIGLA